MIKVNQKFPIPYSLCFRKHLPGWYLRRRRWRMDGKVQGCCSDLVLGWRGRKAEDWRTDVSLFGVVRLPLYQIWRWRYGFRCRFGFKCKCISRFEDTQMTRAASEVNLYLKYLEHLLFYWYIWSSCIRANTNTHSHSLMANVYPGRRDFQILHHSIRQRKVHNLEPLISSHYSC